MIGRWCGGLIYLCDATRPMGERGRRTRDMSRGGMETKKKYVCENMNMMILSEELEEEQQ